MRNTQIENLSVSDPSLVTLSSEKGAVLITATPESSNGDSLTINYETNGITYSFPVTITAHPSKPADASTIWVDFYRDAAGTRPLDNMFGFIYTDQTDTFYLVAKNGWYFTDVELNEILDDVADYSIDDSGSVVKIKLNKMHIDNAFGHSISYTATNGINTVTGMDSLSIYQYQSRIFGYTFKIDENGEYILDANGKLICDTSNKYGTIETYVNSKIPLDINYMKYDEKNHQISSTTKVTNVTSSDTSVCTVTGMGDYVLINTLPTAKEGDTAYIQYTDNGETYSILVKVKSGDFEPTVPSPVWVDFYYDEEATSVIDSTTGFTLTDTEDTYYFIAKNGWTFENITLSNELESIANVTVDESGTIATIKVTGNPSDDSIYAELEYSVSNGVDEVSGIDGVYLYNKKSTLVFRWCSADGGGNLLEDENGNYIPITVRDAETTLNMFLNSEEPIYVYLKNAETKVETQVNYEDLQSSDSSVITISKEKGATLIVVSPTAKVGDVATIDYVIDGEKYSLPVRIISRGFESQLVIRDPDFDANNHPVENIENSTFVGIGSTINTYHTFFFYYIDEEGIETRLDISQLTSSDSDIVKLSKDPSNADAVRVEFVNFGTASIDYTVDGKTHSVEFDVRVPYAGLYTSLNATEKDYIDKFFISPEEENIFYLVAENEYRLTRVELNEYLDAIADIELDESGTFAKITVTGVLSVDAWYEISYDVINTEYGYEVNDILRVPVLNDSQLMYREPYNDYLLLSEIWGYENTSSELFFYYVDKTGVETKVSANQLVTSDPNVVKISENTLNSDATHLEFVGEGSATIAYTIDDITYTLNVEVNAYSPYVDFFDIPDMVNGECFWTYEVTDEEDTFYLVVEDGWKFTEVTLLDEFADIADVQIDTTNGNYATIKVTGVPKNQEYDLKYVVQNIDDPESTDFNFRFIELINSKSACAHADIHIINAKPATCEEDGYTGDGVCIDCEEVVKEGAVIPATGHNYVDGECEHCGEWIGWHEAEDGNWYFYTEGEVDTTINGIVANGDEYWYAVNGKTDFTITTVAQYGEEWWYVENGKVNFTYTGLAQNEGGWWYMENGVLNWDYTGLTCYYDTWYYVENGGLCWNYTGLTEYYGTWYYVENSVLNWGYTGLTEYFGTWYYVENGVLNWNYTGLTCYYDTWYYVEGGILNWNYTGLTCYYDTWYYVESGVLNWGYTGLTCYYDTWYYVEGGVLNWGYTGLTCYYDTWYYVENGILNWSYIGLTEYYGGWYYVEGGVLNWGFTGLVEYYGTWYYVGNGVLDWGFTGNVYQYGTWWYVENGIMIGEVQVG